MVKQGVYLALLVAAALVLCVSAQCGGGALTPTLVPADYPYSTVFDNGMELYWDVVEEGGEKTLNMAMRAQTTGYVSVGFDPEDGGHLNCDMIIGYVDGGTVNVNDYYSTAKNNPPRDATNDILDCNGEEVNGATTIKFTRKLNTGDGDDKPINEDGETGVVWATANADPANINDIPSHDGVNRGLSPINLLTGGVGSLRSLTEAHAFLLSIGFGFIMMGAFLVGRFIKVNENYIKIHLMIHSLGAVVITTGYILGFWISPRLFNTLEHGVLGHVTMLMVYSQLLAGVVADRNLSYKTSEEDVPFWPFGFHKYVGWTTLALGFLTVFTGLVRYGMPIAAPWTQAWLIWVGFVALAFGLTFTLTPNFEILEDRADELDDANRLSFLATIDAKDRKSKLFALPSRLSFFPAKARDQAHRGRGKGKQGKAHRQQGRHQHGGRPRGRV